MEDPVVPLERNLFGHLLAAFSIGKAIRESSIGTQLGRSSKFVSLIVTREEGLFLSVHVDDIKTGWEEAER